MLQHWLRMLTYVAASCCFFFLQVVVTWVSNYFEDLMMVWLKIFWGNAELAKTVWSMYICVYIKTCLTRKEDGGGGT